MMNTKTAREGRTNTLVFKSGYENLTRSLRDTGLEICLEDSLGWAYFGTRGGRKQKKTLVFPLPVGLAASMVGKNRVRLSPLSTSCGASSFRRVAKTWVHSLEKRLLALSRRAFGGKNPRSSALGSERSRELKGTGYRVRSLTEAYHRDRVEIGHCPLVANQSTVRGVLGLEIGCANEVQCLLPEGVAAVVKSNSTSFSLIGFDEVTLGNAAHLLETLKPRNPYTGVGVIDPKKSYPKLKPTKRGGKK
jgi:hypothetical protein